MLWPLIWFIAFSKPLDIEVLLQRHALLIKQLFKGMNTWFLSVKGYDILVRPSYFVLVFSIAITYMYIIYIYIYIYIYISAIYICIYICIIICITHYICFIILLLYIRAIQSRQNLSHSSYASFFRSVVTDFL